MGRCAGVDFYVGSSVLMVLHLLIEPVQGGEPCGIDIYVRASRRLELWEGESERQRDAAVGQGGISLSKYVPKRAGVDSVCFRALHSVTFLPLGAEIQSMDYMVDYILTATSSNPQPISLPM